MKKLLLIAILCFGIPAIYIEAEESVVEMDGINMKNVSVDDVLTGEIVESYQNPTVLSSYLLLGHSDYISKNSCTFSWTFLKNTTGSCTVVLQKKSGSTWSDTSYKRNFSFTNAGYFDGSLPVSNLANGTYRLKYSFTSPTTETVTSGETVIN